MDDHVNPTAAVDRRRLLRAGAVLAGVAGASAATALAGTGTAEAADGGQLLLGRTNESSSATRLRLAGAAGGDAPALQLANASGPALALEPVEDAGRDLQPGELRMLSYGLELGFADGRNPAELILTEADIAFQPFLNPTDPSRLLDTRKGGQSSLIGSSKDAFDSSHRLRAGAWMDVLLYDQDDPVYSVMLNLHTLNAKKSGYLKVYADAGNPPDGSSLDFQAKVTTSGSTLVGLRYVDIGTDGSGSVGGTRRGSLSRTHLWP